MPIDLQGLKSRLRPIIIPIPWAEGESINAKYRPSSVSSTLFDELIDQQATPRMKPLAEILMRILATWDVVENGKPVSLTQDALMEFDPRILQAFTRVILEDLGGNPERVNGSPAT